VDLESRQHQHNQANIRPGASRKLGDVVTQSTERWLLANDDADREYREELLAMGYRNEELEEAAQQRGVEYHGMLRVGCHRVVQTIPERIIKLSTMHVVSISAGYAHCMALTDTGGVYSSGYNDRGQLGIGHRISTADFTYVKKLESYFVVQIVCGQQHSLCRAVSRDRATEERITTGSDVGTEVFAWGNGILGQLGMGRRGTSKGRLVPTLIIDFCRTSGVSYLASGANFSVAVTTTGEVWSWGHAEYNQHGTGATAGTDYTDPYHFFTPRQVMLTTSDPVKDPVTKVLCGSNFSIAITRSGEAYSWGWGTYGCLGRGVGHHSSAPERISSLGLRSSERQVTHIAAGANHVLSIVSSANWHWAADNTDLLEDRKFVDAQIEFDGCDRVFYCHRVMLAARSNYFRGYLRSASMDSPAITFVRSAPADGDESASRKVTRVYLSGTAATAVTVAGLLEYIYTDKFHVPVQKCSQLEQLAAELGMTRLVVLARRARRRGTAFIDDNAMTHLSPSTYVSDLAAMVSSTEYADIMLQTSPYEVSNDSYTVGKNGSSIDSSSSLSQCKILYGHKCLLRRMSYFNSLFASTFKENSEESIAENGMLLFNLDGFAADGIDFASFRNVLYFVYTGSMDSPYGCDGKTDGLVESEEDGGYMSMLVAGNRLGIPTLAEKCEHLLYSHLTDYPENIENCLSFAQMYDLPRLERLCEQLQQA